MSNTRILTLAEEIRLVTANLESREWIQGEMQRGDKVCAHGAVMTCKGLRPGDEWIIRAVMRTRGITEAWNDDEGRTKGEIVARVAAIGATDDDLAETFGPSWRLVVAVIRRAASLTADEVNTMDAAWGAARDAAWGAAWGAARGAAWGAAWGAARGAAWGAAWGAAMDAAWGAARDAAWGGAVADLVGQHGLTQDHIDTLMGPWVSVLGENWADEVSA